MVAAEQSAALELKIHNYTRQLRDLTRILILMLLMMIERGTSLVSLSLCAYAANKISQYLINIQQVDEVKNRIF